MSLKFQVIGPPLLSGVFTEAARFAAPCDAAPRFGRATFALLVFSRPSSFRLSFHSPCWDVARTFSVFERGRRGGDYLAAPAIRVLLSLTTWPWPTDPVAAPSSSREWRKSFSPAAAPRRPS